MSKGHIRQRGARDEQGRCSWELKFDLGTDAATGKRRVQYVSFRGTKREAQTRLADMISAAGKGSYVEASRLTVAEHMRARLAHWKASSEISAKTAERYGELIEGQIVPHIGAMAVQKLKPFDLEKWHDTLKASGRKDGKGGVSARTIGHAHRILAKALAEAARNDLVSRNVAALEGAPKVEAEEIQILGAEQIKKLLASLRGRPPYAAIVTALFTGLRRGELLALRWAALDLDGKTLAVDEALELTKAGVAFKVPKTKAGTRDISLPDLVVDALREHRRAALEQRIALGLGKLPDDALIFPALDGGPRCPRDFSKAWARIAEAEGFPEVTLHALRHTHASQLIAAGLDVVTISRRMGHASPNVTLAVYAHLFRHRDDKAAAAVNAAVAGLGI